MKMKEKFSTRQISFFQFNDKEDQFSFASETVEMWPEKPPFVTSENVKFQLRIRPAGLIGWKTFASL